MTYSSVHACHELPAWSLATLCGTHVWASPWQLWLLLHRGYTRVTSWLCYMRLCYGYIMVMSWLLLQLLRQIGDRLCYGCHASLERINMSAVPMTPCIFFRPLSQNLAYSEFSKQCGQCEQDWQYATVYFYHYVPDIELRALCLLFNSYKNNNLWGRYYYTYFTSGN